MECKYEKPFIKLLRSPNSGYFFDVNRNEIIAVDDEAYDFLEKVEADKLNFSNSSKPESIRALAEQGYLSGNKVKEIRHPLTDYVEILIARNMQKITLQLTQDCNFRCSYCTYSLQEGTQRMHSNKKMSLETAKKAVDFLWEHSADSEEVCIGFYGGEPLLEFDMIKEIVAYANFRFEGKALLYTITTNASLLKPEIVNFLCDNNFSILISVDGSKDVHDKNRVFASNGHGTFDTVIKNLNEACQINEKFATGLSINMVLDPSSDFEKIDELFKDELIFTKGKVQSTIIDDTFTANKNTFSESFLSKQRYQTFLGNMALKGLFPENKVSQAVRGTVLSFYDQQDKYFPTVRLSEIQAPGGPCLPGQMRPMVVVDGNIFPCERVSEVSCAMNIGHIDTGFDYEKIRKLINVGALTPEECKNCWTFTHCGACARVADDDGRLSGKRKLIACEQQRANMEYFVRKMILLREVTQFYKVSFN